MDTDQLIKDLESGSDKKTIEKAKEWLEHNAEDSMADLVFDALVEFNASDEMAEWVKFWCEKNPEVIPQTLRTVWRYMPNQHHSFVMWAEDYVNSKIESNEIGYTIEEIVLWKQPSLETLAKKWLQLHGNYHGAPVIRAFVQAYPDDLMARDRALNWLEKNISEGYYIAMLSTLVEAAPSPRLLELCTNEFSEDPCISTFCLVEPMLKRFPDSKNVIIQWIKEHMSHRLAGFMIGDGLIALPEEFFDLALLWLSDWSSSMGADLVGLELCHQAYSQVKMQEKLNFWLQENLNNPVTVCMLSHLLEHTDVQGIREIAENWVKVNEHDPETSRIKKLLEEKLPRVE